MIRFRFFISFFCEFYKMLRIYFDRIPPDDYVLCLWSLRSFSEHLFYRAPMGNCLLHGQVSEFQSADTVRNYLTGAFQGFYTRTRSSRSKVFIYLKSLKIICEEVNSKWSCEIPTWIFPKKLFHTFSLMYFYGTPWLPYAIIFSILQFDAPIM